MPSTDPGLVLAVAAVVFAAALVSSIAGFAFSALAGAALVYVLQDPVRMGYLGVKTMVSHLKGEKVERRIDTGVHIATPDTMDDPKMKELLAPDLSQ